MTAEVVKAYLKGIGMPVSKIEKELGIPATTLQKALKYGKKVADKWDTPLKEFRIKKLGFDGPPLVDTGYDEPLKFSAPAPWIREIKDYCQKEGFEPDQFLSRHQLLTVAVETLQKTVEELQPAASSWYQRIAEQQKAIQEQPVGEVTFTETRDISKQVKTQDISEDPPSGLSRIELMVWHNNQKMKNKRKQ